MGSSWRLFTTGAGRRRAEPATATVAAMHQTLTELLFCVCRQVQQAFPGQRPLGMAISHDELMALEHMEDHFLLQDAPAIVGADQQARRRPTALSRHLEHSGRRWALHVIETPIAWAIHALYILITVAWSGPLFHSLTGGLLPLLSLPADIALYIFGPWCWTVGLRLVQGRQLAGPHRPSHPGDRGGPTAASTAEQLCEQVVLPEFRHRFPRCPWR